MKAKSRLKKKTINKLTWALIIATLATSIAIATLFGYIEKMDQASLERLKQAFVIEKPVQAMAIVTPTVTFTPRAKTIKLINANPDLSAKIKTVFGSEWTYAAELIARESSFNKYAINPSSGACSLAQALPCSKMACTLDDEDCQLLWIRDYVIARYGGIKQALDHHNLKNWY